MKIKYEGIEKLFLGSQITLIFFEKTKEQKESKRSPHRKKAESTCSVLYKYWVISPRNKKSLLVFGPKMGSKLSINEDYSLIRTNDGHSEEITSQNSPQGRNIL